MKDMQEKFGMAAFSGRKFESLVKMRVRQRQQRPEAAM